MERMGKALLSAWEESLQGAAPGGLGMIPQEHTSVSAGSWICFSGKTPLDGRAERDWSHLMRSFEP